VVGVRNQSAVCELALGLGLLRREDMAHLGLAPLDLAGAGLFEALGRAAVCLHFGHGLPMVCRWFGDIRQYTGGWAAGATQGALRTGGRRSRGNVNANSHFLPAGEVLTPELLGNPLPAKHLCAARMGM